MAAIENMMRTNMGGGLPAIGFYEMKWDIYDTARCLEGGGMHADGRAAFFSKCLPVLQVIDANDDLREQCAKHDAYQASSMQPDLLGCLNSYIHDAYEAGVVVPNFRELVEEANAEDWVAEPTPEQLQALDAEHILGCIAWHFRRDHFVEGSLISCSVAGGHMVRMLEAYLEKVNH